MDDIKEVVSTYLTEADRLSERNLDCSFMYCRKAVEAIADNLNHEQEIWGKDEWIGVPKRLKSLKKAGIISKKICNRLISIAITSNEHCHHNTNSVPIRQKYGEIYSEIRDIFFELFDSYPLIKDDSDVSLLNRQSIEKTQLCINNDDDQFVDEEALNELLFQAQICKMEGEFDQAEEFAKISLEGFIAIEQKLGECRSKLLLSDIYDSENRNQESIIFASAGYKIAIELNLIREQGWAIHNLGILNEKIGNYDEARSFFKKSLGLMQKTKSGKLDIAKVQNSLAINYLNHPNNRDLDEAFILLKAAFKNMEDDPEPLLMGSVLDCLSFIELEMKNYVVSLDMAYGAREMYRLGNAGSSVEKVLNKRIKRLRKYVKRK
ncbi:MAG: hypothetical protein CMA39_00240 [Euryarchaeota archaeon]|nr:hypothetical protein [Euryarchaeota archaeon]